METTQMEMYDQPKFFYQCKKHGQQVKYFCVEIQAIDSLLCESCYQERHAQRSIKVLLFELIYNEVQQEISKLNIEDLLLKCITYTEQVKSATLGQNLYQQNEDIIEILTKNINKSYETLTRLRAMKERINDKIWSSYFVQAVKNKTAINQAKFCLSIVEQNIEQIKKGYFSYHRGLQAASAFLLDNKQLLIQDRTGNIYIYSSNNLQLLIEPIRENNKKFSKAIKAFNIGLKKIGVLHENANLVIYKITFNNKLAVLKRIMLMKVPQSIHVSRNFLIMDYKIFKTTINAKNCKFLSKSSQYCHLLKMETQRFFENYLMKVNNQIVMNQKDIFQDKKHVKQLELHTSRKCLSCLSWICSQQEQEKSLLKYRNDENQLIRIFQYGVRF